MSVNVENYPQYFEYKHEAVYSFWSLDPAYSHLLYPYCKTDLAMYVVATENEAQIINDIMSWREINPSLPILIVDISQEENDFTSLKAMDSCQILRCAALSTNKMQSKTFLLLNQMIVDMLGQKALKQTPMNSVKRRVIPNSPLYNALDRLDGCMKGLPPKVVEGIAQATESYIDTLKNGGHINYEVITKTYLQACELHWHGQGKHVKQIIYTGVTMAIIALAVGLIGFTIGFSLGIWSGPGAFLSGIIAGAATAEAVLVTSGVVGLGLGGLLSYQFFKPDPLVEGVTKAVNQVAVESRALAA